MIVILIVHGAGDSVPQDQKLTTICYQGRALDNVLRIEVLPPKAKPCYHASGIVRDRSRRFE